MLAVQRDKDDRVIAYVEYIIVDKDGKMEMQIPFDSKRKR